MKSKDFAILVDELEKEIIKHRTVLMDMLFGKLDYDKRAANIAQDYIVYHEEMIRFVKRLDKELAEEKPSSNS